jgi:hypothetical protein
MEIFLSLAIKVGVGESKLYVVGSAGGVFGHHTVPLAAFL